MGLPNEIHPFLITGNDANQYKITNSLRFRGSNSAYLSRTPASAGNRKTWTWSGWVKLGTSAISSFGTLFGTGGTTDSTRLIAQLNTSGTLQIDVYTVNLRISNSVFRDPSSWYHIVIVFDSTNATATNRLRAYSNNVELTWSTINAVTLNADYGINNNTAHAIGYDITNNGRYLDGYISEVNFIDGQALTPSAFGYTDTLTNQWMPKQYTGPYGTNGFYLPFNDKASVTDLTVTATLTAPFGGTASNARVADGSIVLSNTSTGSSFTFVQQDFGSQVQLTRFSISSLYFTGGTSTFQVQYGNDPTWNTFTVASSLSVTGNPRNFTGSINGYARYVRLIPTAFGTNGQAGVDAFNVYQDDFYLPNSVSPTASYSATFNGSSQYLVSATNAGLALGTSDFTIEYWMNTTTAQNGATLCCAGTGTVSYDGLFGYTSSGSLQTYLSSTGSSWDIAAARSVIASIVTGRWYHIAYTRSGSTWRVFVDGTQVDTFTSSASLYQSASQFTLGRAQGTGYFNGRLSNVRIIKGTALYTSNFSPSVSPLTAITNTQLLTLQDATIIDNSTNALSITNTGTVTTSGSVIPWSNFIIGRDYSTNGFGWMSNNINATTPGATYDVMKDVPSNWDDGGTGRGNYCTLSPLTAASGTLSEANLTHTSSTGNAQRIGTIIVPANSGKWYFEVDMASVPASGAGDSLIGISEIINNTSYASQYPGQATTSYAAYCYLANSYIAKYTNASAINTNLLAPQTGDVIGVAFDLTNGYIWFAKNNTWADSGNPSTGTSPAYSFTPAAGSGYTPAFRGGGGGTGVTLSPNFGQRPFLYTPPIGFKALNTYNLANPSLPLV